MRSAPRCPSYGGSADLTPSNGTLRKDSVMLTPESPAGNYVHSACANFGMSGAVLNGYRSARGIHFRTARHLPDILDYARNAE